MLDFTKIKCFGSDCILVTSRHNHNPKIPLLILEKEDIQKINKCFQIEEKRYNPYCVHCNLKKEVKK